MCELRDEGIYMLPDGTILLARRMSDGSYVFRSPVPDDRSTISHTTDSSGKVLRLSSQLTSWRIEDLTDTGRTLQAAEQTCEELLVAQ